MPRPPRASRSWIGAYLLGTASAPLSGLALPSVQTAASFSAAAVVSFAALGCQDESQPEFWVEKLEDNAWRVRAIKQLDQFYEDAVTRANQAGDAPEVKALKK